MNTQETKEFIIKTLKETSNNIENEKLDDFYWNMVKEFDEYTYKNESIDEAIINEVLKTDCGLELQQASIALIKNYKLPTYSNSFSLKDKIQWLIDYINTVNIKDLIGLKLTNAGIINYNLKNKHFSNNFIIHVGNCKSNSEKLTNNTYQPCGLHHMKYGKNKHWNKSCNALLNIPTEFANPVKVYQSKNPKLKYNYVFYSPNGYTYAFGVPYNKQHETILISCY